MNNDYIALLDSGIGGLSLLIELQKILPHENYLYFGDNQNAPYGNKPISTLRDLTLKNIDIIKRFNVKALVVACNTLSVNLIGEIESYSNLKTFGVFPPVEKAVMENSNSLLLATCRTAQNYNKIKGLTAIGLKELAQDIENNAFSLDKVSLDKNFSQSYNFLNDLTCYYDCIILGCTHYFFVKNKIFDHFRPQKILFGESFTATCVKKYLETSKSLANQKQNCTLFIGENAKFNKCFFDCFTKNLII